MHISLYSHKAYKIPVFRIFQEFYRLRYRGLYPLVPNPSPLRLVRLVPPFPKFPELPTCRLVLVIRFFQDVPLIPLIHVFCLGRQLIESQCIPAHLASPSIPGYPFIPACSYVPVLTASCMRSPFPSFPQFSLDARYSALPTFALRGATLEQSNQVV